MEGAIRGHQLVPEWLSATAAGCEHWAGSLYISQWGKWRQSSTVAVVSVISRGHLGPLAFPFSFLCILPKLGDKSCFSCLKPQDHPGRRRVKAKKLVNDGGVLLSTPLIKKKWHLLILFLIPKVISANWGVKVGKWGLMRGVKRSGNR